MGNDWNPKWICSLVTRNWEIIRLHPLIKEEIEESKSEAKKTLQEKK